MGRGQIFLKQVSLTAGDSGGREYDRNITHRKLPACGELSGSLMFAKVIHT